METTTAEFTGQCLCGAIHYSLAGPPIAVVACHCINCRRQGGAAYSVNALFMKTAYSQTGHEKVFHDKGDSGARVDRHFCGECGSPIFTAAEVMPDMIGVKVGTMDKPDSFVPTREIYCDRAFPWLPEIPDAERTAGAP